MRHKCGLPRRIYFGSICALVYGVSVNAVTAGDAPEDVAASGLETNAQLAQNLRKPHIDPAHGLKFHYGTYPPEAERRKEEGVCWVRTMVDTDGAIRATQLLRSTGSESLDRACLFAFPGQRMLPATVDGTPVIAWTNIPNVWKLSYLKHTGRAMDPRPPIPDAAPTIRDDYHLQVGPSFLPASSTELSQDGNCIVSVNVSEFGVVTEPRIIVSTKFAALDQACLEAAANAQFIPGTEDGHPISGSTLLAMYWHR